jgi:hypothetical protein
MVREIVGCAVLFNDLMLLKLQSLEGAQCNALRDAIRFADLSLPKYFQILTKSLFMYAYPDSHKHRSQNRHSTAA